MDLVTKTRLFWQNSQTGKNDLDDPHNGQVNGLFTTYKLWLTNN